MNSFADAHSIGDLDYARGRIMARLADLPGVDELARLRPVNQVAHYLDALRHTSLKPWLESIRVDSSAHDVERELRLHYQRILNETLAWTPDSANPALAWMAYLPYLPMLSWLALEQTPQDWMYHDALLREIIDDPAQHPMLAADWNGRIGIEEYWLNLLRSAMPKSNVIQIDKLFKALAAVSALDELYTLEHQTSGRDALVSIIRRGDSGCAPLAWMGVNEWYRRRLRAGLLRRILFASRGVSA